MGESTTTTNLSNLQLSDRNMNTSIVVLFSCLVSLAASQDVQVPSNLNSNNNMDMAVLSSCSDGDMLTCTEKLGATLAQCALDAVQSGNTAPCDIAQCMIDNVPAADSCRACICKLFAGDMFCDECDSMLGGGMVVRAINI